MPATLLRASINRHLPFLTPPEKRLLNATPAERKAVERTVAIGRSWGVILPRARA